MGKSIKYTGHYTQLNVLKNIIGIEYIRLRRAEERDNKGNILERLLDLNFITLSFGPDQYTECIFIVRFTRFWQEQILGFLNENNIPQERPDGENWFEEYSRGNFTGNPSYEYYPLSAFGQLFEDAVIQRAKEVEDIWYGKSLVIFKIDDIRFYDDGSISSIPFVRNQEEIEEAEREEEERRERWEASDEYDRRHGKGFYDANSWMDNPDDYWNID